MRKIGYVLILALLTVFTASCHVNGAAAPPELSVPVTVKADTAKVTRGNVESMAQYKGLVRVHSDKLYFGDTGLRFEDYYAVTGQYVEEGQLLAKLDTEWIEEQIEAQEDNIAHMKKENAFENELLALEISIAQLELIGLAQQAAGYDEEAMKAAELTKLNIERRQLALEQALERQALSLKYAEEDLRELRTKMAGAELRAPYAGTITYMEEKWPGAAVEPYAPLMYISNGQEIFVEYASLVNVSLSRSHIIKGRLGGQVYDLERIPLSTQDMLYYNLNRLTPPLRFAVLNPDERIVPGAYISIYVYSDIRENALRVPVNTVYADAEIGSYVYRMDDGKKTLTPVEIGLRSAVYIEILDGLEEGDVVFVKQ